MTKEEIKELIGLAASMGLYDDKNPCKRAVILGKAIEILKQEPCEDCISRKVVLDIVTEQERLASDRVRDTPLSLGNGLRTWVNPAYTRYSAQLSERSQFKTMIQSMPPVNPQKTNIGHCKDCKYFEYDSVAKVDGVPLIMAHEICTRWGDGCKTSEDGYCFLFEPKEGSEKK